MQRTLLLNASHEPLCVVPLRRAVILVVTEKAVIVEAGEGVLRSERMSLAQPIVIKLTRYVRVPYVAKMPLSRQGVMARDAQRCQYCGGAAETLDHVLPRSRGGRHVWENLVAACRRCNHKKADRTLVELGWSLDRRPVAPRGAARLIIGLARVEPAWAPYVGLPAIA